MLQLKQYLKDNLLPSLKLPPWRAPIRAWMPLPAFALFAFGMGLGTGLLQWDPAPFIWLPVLAVVLFVSPSVMEEVLFRGLLVPRSSFSKRGWAAMAPLVISTLAYVAWHPIGAFYGTEERAIFADGRFLLIVAALGLACAYSYRASGSLWVPILIHWVTVLIWVLCLGGHAIVLARLAG